MGDDDQNSENPAVSEQNNEKPVVSAQTNEKPAVSIQNQEKSGISEQNNEKPAISERNNEKPTIPELPWPQAIGAKTSTQNDVEKKKKEIEFAPLSVPYERRMQTLAVSAWAAIFFVINPGGVILSFYIYFYTRYWYLTLLYLVWIYVDRDSCNTGGTTWSTSVRHWKLWKYYKDYFPVTLIKTTELDPTKNYLVACHPHGILSSGAFAVWSTEAMDISKVFPGLTINFLTLRQNFMLPFLREVSYALGMCSASRESMNYLLSYPGGGKMAILIPGGAAESLDAHSGTYKLKLKNRKGFVKLALQNGVSIVPVFGFGENDIYEQLDNPEGSLLRTFQEKVQKKIGIAPVIANGRGLFQYSYGILPKRSPLVTIVGAPIEAKHLPHPTNEEIDAHHELYVQALTKLFDDYKGKYGKPGDVLTLV